MKIAIPRADLARLLTNTTKAVEARNTIPILSTVRLQAAADRLTITATDLDIEIRGSAAAECTPGEICVDAKLLAGIVGKAAGDTVTMELKDGTLTVKAGRSVFRLPTLPASDFPEITQGDLPTEFDVDLAALFAPVQFAISTEESRFWLNGIYLAGEETSLTAVATDGHRLSRNQGESVGRFASIIVPRKTVGLVPKGVIGVALSDTKIRFTTADTVITSKLIDGTFPDYQRVIPTGNDKEIVFASPAMRQAADRVSLVSTERGRAVKISFAPGQVVLSVNESGAGSATEEISVEYDGEPMFIGFNVAYLAEVIGCFPAGDIRLSLADAGSPALMKSDAAPGLLAVLMPMRVG